VCGHSVGGSVQYQQLTAGWNPASFMDFVWCTSENSATPLLDLQVSPAVMHNKLDPVKGFSGLHDITVIDFNSK
jgi:hypothetical protein